MKKKTLVIILIIAVILIITIMAILIATGVLDGAFKKTPEKI